MTGSDEADGDITVAVSPAATLTIVSGAPTDEELAAVVAVLSARSGSSAVGGASSRRTPSEWAAPRHRMRPAVRRRPDGWRSSALPH